MRKARSKAPPKKARPSRGRSVVPAFRVSPKLLVTIFAAAALVMILAAVVPLLVPTSAYRSWVETELSRYVDARVSMGRFRFQLLPYPGYTITDMELASSSAPFQGQTFLHAKKVRGSLSFLGLLRGRAITDLGASGVTVDIRSLAGATNVSSVLKISGSGALPPSDGDAAPRGAPPAFEPRGESSEIKVLPALPAETPKGMPGSLPAKEEEKEKPAGPTTNPSGDEGRLSILIRNAHAQGPDFPYAGKGRMEIGRLDVSSGRVNVWDDGALLYSAEGVSFAAEKIPSANGFGAGVRAAGRVSGSRTAGAQAAPFDVGLSGQIFVDSLRREAGARSMRITIAGSQFVVDMSLNYGVSPSSFDFRVATPDLGSRAAAPLMEIFGQPFPKELGWSGPISADLSFKGTVEALDVAANVDAAPARIAFSDLFTKGAGLPFRASLSFFSTPQSLMMREGRITMGQESFEAEAELGKEPGGLLKLSASGSNIDASVLKTFFPRLSFLESFEDMELSLKASGDPHSAAPLGVMGTFKGKLLSSAGFEITDVEGNFERAGTADVPSGAGPPLVIPTLRGVYAGGELSGNGSVEMSSPFGLSMEIVVSRSDAQLLSALGETLEGEASVVAAISGSGRDQVELSKNAKASGSILISEGSWKEIRIAEALFAPDALKKMEEAVGESFAEAAKQRLVSLTGEIRDAKISFESVGEAGELSEVSWSQGPIEFNANGKVEAGLLNLQGKAAVEKGLSAELVAAPASRKLLFDSEGKILLPITISGKVSSPEFSVDIGKLTAKLKERETAAPGPAASVEEKPKAPAKPAVSPKPKPHVRKKRAPGGEPERKPVLTPDKKRQRSSVPPTGEQVDDILKVIIGN